MSEPVVRTETRGSCLIITLDRPRVHNAIDPQLAREVAEALARLDAEPSLRVAVVTGTKPSFCAGMDLRAFRGASAETSAATLDLMVLHPTRKPVLAAVEGNALGGGFEFALSCDVIVAAEDARFGLPEVRWALVPSGGGLLRLPALLPPAVAMEMALSGQPRSGREMNELGLVARLAESGGALEAALELAETIAANGPRAVAAAKELVRLTGAGDPREHWHRQEEICAEVNTSADAREGVEAFLARRRPEYGAG